MKLINLAANIVTMPQAAYHIASFTYNEGWLVMSAVTMPQAAYHIASRCSLLRSVVMYSRVTMPQAAYHIASVIPSGLAFMVFDQVTMPQAAYHIARAGGTNPLWKRLRKTKVDNQTDFCGAFILICSFCTSQTPKQASGTTF